MPDVDCADCLRSVGKLMGKMEIIVDGQHRQGTALDTLSQMLSSHVAVGVERDTKEARQSVDRDTKEERRLQVSQWKIHMILITVGLLSGTLGSAVTTLLTHIMGVK